MVFPLLVPMLVGAGMGSLIDKDKPLRGAALGATAGFGGAGLLGAGAAGGAAGGAGGSGLLAGASSAPGVGGLAGSLGSATGSSIIPAGGAVGSAGTTSALGVPITEAVASTGAASPTNLLLDGASSAEGIGGLAGSLGSTPGSGLLPGAAPSGVANTPGGFGSSLSPFSQQLLVGLLSNAGSFAPKQGSAPPSGGQLSRPGFTPNGNLFIEFQKRRR
jgi:hypothetical protein